MAEGYGWSGATVTVWNWARWPVGVVLVLVHRRGAPRPRPAPSAARAELAGARRRRRGRAHAGSAPACSRVYVGLSPSFGDVYGPLAGVVALLLWTLLTSVALFYGAALCAQLEACRAGQPEPAYDDPGRPERVTVGEEGATHR